MQSAMVAFMPSRSPISCFLFALESHGAAWCKLMLHVSIKGQVFQPVCRRLVLEYAMIECCVLKVARPSCK
eukprot:21535-Amphidinium_carterae.2